MKKIFKSACIVALGVALFTSCGEDETEAPDRTGSVTIQGTVAANTNYLGKYPSNLEPATGAIVRVKYANEDLSYTGVNGNDEEDIVKTTTVGEDGKYSIAVDAINVGVDYEISIDDYTTTVRDSIRTQFESDQPRYAAGEFSATYSVSSQDITAVSGETKVVNFTLGSPKRVESFGYFEAKNFNKTLTIR